MKYRELGNTDIKVSAICLGTMTFGEQNTEEEAHQQMDYAFDCGINFMDVAELYPIAPRKETQGLTEQYVGTWLKNKNRDKIVLATKVTGPSSLSYIDSDLRYNSKRIRRALDQSLLRLQTSYVDLYQMHWPERMTNFFGRRGYTVHDEKWEDSFLESVSTMNDLIQEGKIRAFGLSNETPWGLHRTLTLATTHGLKPPASVQNPYSLLNRLYEVGLAEMSIRENVSLLAYSPLAMGMLSGKYVLGTDSPGDRLNRFKQYDRYNSENCKTATSMYMQIAKEHGVEPAQLAIAFVNQQPFVTSTIIGATSMAQLQLNMASTEITLPRDIIRQINEVQEHIPDPAP